MSVGQNWVYMIYRPFFSVGVPTIVPPFSVTDEGDKPNLIIKMKNGIDELHTRKLGIILPGAGYKPNFRFMI